MNDWTMPGAPTGGKCGLERITGPWDGIYVAAYTTELDGHFYGYAKLCTSRPTNMWTVHVMMKITARSGYFFETDALEAVEKRALRVIAKLRPPSFWSALFSLG